MASRKISEKTLELNVCAEMLRYIRSWPGCEKALWVGLTQAQESREGIDEKLRNGFSFMLQFKSPWVTSRVDDLYKFSINERQHQAMEALAQGRPKAVFYVLPLYSEWDKADRHAPDLVQDTWLLPISSIPYSLLTSQSAPSTGLHRVEVQRDGSGVDVIVHSPEVVSSAINARTYFEEYVAIEGGRQFVSSVGIPSEELQMWLARLRDTDGDPQNTMLRFRKLNALFLPG